ncbi:hypothetical protein BN946_scf184665.g9 [Trametes cinnabarina]|uniref:EthD domain-containing protein n=1 Tax=Pycnoporus cinnabarinus TaxID=5643 RepID=A0A060SNA2_PYCCI|nr:hypothetical protein BN946_scf184665.g9 [Trametes cinnabarina]
MSAAATPTSKTAPDFRKDRVRVCGLMAKKQGVTDEEFSRHWREVHGPLFEGMEITKKNILLYEQHHYITAFDEGVAALGFDVVQYRGIAVFEAQSYEKIFEVFQSEEYKRIVLPDEANFIERSKTGFVAGDIVTFLKK